MSELIFQTERVSERITRIFAFSSELMYLIEGDEQAALIDSGSGIGFVKPLIDKLTDKPVIVLLTHGHVDHAMGASEFLPEQVYINQEDAGVYGIHSTYEFRKSGLFLMGEAGETVTEADFTPIVPITAYNDLKEGDRFDLGNITVEIYACPGHTKGSLVMLIPEEGALILGDACNCNTFIFEEYSLSIEEYKNSLCRLQENLKGCYQMVLLSHGDGKAVPEVMDENIKLCDRILQRKDDKIPMEFRGSKGLVADGNAEPGHGNIIYSPDRIYRDQKNALE